MIEAFAKDELLCKALIDPKNGRFIVQTRRNGHFLFVGHSGA
jgi:hypothetical protein